MNKRGGRELFTDFASRNVKQFLHERSYFITLAFELFNKVKDVHKKINKQQIPIYGIFLVFYGHPALCYITS